jgi:hypothetical protein
MSGIACSTELRDALSYVVNKRVPRLGGQTYAHDAAESQPNYDLLAKIQMQAALKNSSQVKLPEKGVSIRSAGENLHKSLSCNIWICVRVA